MKKRIFAIVVMVLGVLPAFAGDTIKVHEPWARASILSSRPGAAYVTIESTTGDRLVVASTPVAKRVMIHNLEASDGIARMKHLEELEIPAGQPVTLAPGGMHLMLMGLRGKLVEGTTFPMTLGFEKAGEITVDVSVFGIATLEPRKSTK